METKKTLRDSFFSRASRHMTWSNIPIQAKYTPEDVAHLVTFLCSEKAKHITGEVIKVDGGQYI